MRKMVHLLILIVGCTTFVHAQNEIIPKGWVVIDSIIGNLDDDESNEKVLVYNTLDSTDFGKRREIRIFKKEAKNWVLWKSSNNALFKSGEGGMMGDPYQGTEIKNNILLIHQAGGSSWKWSQTDMYRFQNNQFELIGYTSSSGKYCEEATIFDFNISTGKINYKKEILDCETEEGKVIDSEQETFYKKGIELTLKNRNYTEIEIVSPKLKCKLYL